MGERLLASEFDEDKIFKLSSEVFNSLDMLKELSKLPKDDFLEDKFKVASAKYFLIVSIEATIDMCNHLISRNRFRIPESYADTFKVIAECGVISKDLMEKLIEMAKFRNRLVHIYWEVDEEVIYEIIKEDIRDIEEFMDKFMEFLNKN
ncbi:MAG: DUF86 domain-containing protein [Methanobacterium sp.]|jgi:uncharacterized protein YutE (UPF0331/DUF86 family)